MCRPNIPTKDMARPWRVKGSEVGRPFIVDANGNVVDLEPGSGVTDTLDFICDSVNAFRRPPEPGAAGNRGTNREIAVRVAGQSLRSDDPKALDKAIERALDDLETAKAAELRRKDSRIAQLEAENDEYDTAMKKWVADDEKYDKIKLEAALQSEKEFSAVCTMNLVNWRDRAISAEAALKAQDRRRSPYRPPDGK